MIFERLDTVTGVPSFRYVGHVTGFEPYDDRIIPRDFYSFVAYRRIRTEIEAGTLTGRKLTKFSQDPDDTFVVVCPD